VKCCAGRLDLANARKCILRSHPATSISLLAPLAAASAAVVAASSSSDAAAAPPRHRRHRHHPTPTPWLFCAAAAV